MESENGSASRRKTKWPPCMHEYFVDLCVQETLNGNKPGPSLNKKGWKNVLESLNKKPGFKIDRKRLKNHWDSTRGKWKVWCKLLGTISMKWDPNTRQFGASREDWDYYIKFNPEAALFRNKELEFADKLEIVFPGITPFTEAGFTEPPTQRRRLNDSPTTYLLGPVEEKDTDEAQQQCDTTESKPTNMQPKQIKHQSQTVELAPRNMLANRIEHLYEAVELRPRDIQPNRIEHLYEPVELSSMGTRAKGIKHRCDAVELRPNDTQTERVEQRRFETVESRSGVTVESGQGKGSYSIGECIECLDGMEEVEQGGDIYLFALDVFLRKEYREIFLQLKNPALKIAWLKRLQSVGER